MVVTKPGAMEFGWSIDKALESGYQFLSLNREQREKQFFECYHNVDKYEEWQYQIIPQLAVRKTFTELWPANVKNGMYSQERGLFLLNGYMGRWWPEKGIDIVDADVKGIVPLPEGFNLRIKCDLLFHKDGHYYVRELKTSGSRQRDIFWYNMMRSYQTDGYHMGAETIFDQRVRAVQVDVIWTSTAKSTPITEAFDRREILKSASRRDKYKQWLWSTIGRIDKLSRHMVWPYNESDAENIHTFTLEEIKKGEAPQGFWLENTDNCTAYNKPCPYIEVCEHGYTPGVLANYELSFWRPYMSHEEDTRYEI